ncbi:hypothetical protein [Mariprofundus ferrooxydans]|uniref:Uncharacterized protein n=2 Tax=Mariprofundus ferrooxydans TaxID=314344 RepID=Q0EYN9_9PROT|nr:hypothetical protein [Mariprofundus ferrooxydans]EAU54328.1 hypothetical protein SPV1_00075 [Mariprofundus ferrooxydans PV-1]KON47445.1 hypothetical protein AL013_08110 [Mariprofundus ferrooxydans]
MMSPTTVQTAIDDFVRYADTVEKSDAQATPDQCLEMLSQYLVHYSDLFNEMESEEEPADFADWEEGLDNHMSALLEGDVEAVGHLGNLPLEALDPEHMRDFLGWFVLRETSDGELLQAYSDTLRAWVDFILARGWWKHDVYLGFIEVLEEVTPEAVRVARVSRVLFHFIRSGGGVPPRMRGQRFSRFVEGHAQVSTLAENSLQFSFHHQDELIGPVILPAPILGMIEVGDVFDLELGMRGDAWVIVDVGPVYPSCVYVEVEEYQGLDKLS